jgi:opacity protein-like surface antigen
VKSPREGKHNKLKTEEELLMFRKALLAAAFVLAVSASAHAQGDKVQLFGGYSYQRVDNSPSFNQNGWELAGAYGFAPWLSAVVDFDGHYSSGNTNVYTYLFGPKVQFPARVSPFAELLFGGGHAHSGFSSDSSFAWTFSAGVDYKVLPGISWRVIQGGVEPTYFFGTTQNNVRISTGIVFHF